MTDRRPARLAHHQPGAPPRARRRRRAPSRAAACPTSSVVPRRSIRAGRPATPSATLTMPSRHGRPNVSETMTPTVDAGQLAQPVAQPARARVRIRREAASATSPPGMFEWSTPPFAHTKPCRVSVIRTRSERSTRTLSSRTTCTMRGSGSRSAGARCATASSLARRRRRGRTSRPSDLETTFCATTTMSPRFERRLRSRSARRGRRRAGPQAGPRRRSARGASHRAPQPREVARARRGRAPSRPSGGPRTSTPFVSAPRAGTCASESSPKWSAIASGGRRYSALVPPRPIAGTATTTGVVERAAASSISRTASARHERQVAGEEEHRRPRPCTARARCRAARPRSDPPAWLDEDVGAPRRAPARRPPRCPRRPARGRPRPRRASRARRCAGRARAATVAPSAGRSRCLAESKSLIRTIDPRRHAISRPTPCAGAEGSANRRARGSAPGRRPAHERRGG